MACLKWASGGVRVLPFLLAGVTCMRGVRVCERVCVCVCKSTTLVRVCLCVCVSVCLCMSMYGMYVCMCVPYFY